MIVHRILPGALSSGLLLGMAAGASAQTGAAAPADRSAAVSVDHVADLAWTGGAGGDGRVRYLDDLQIAADLDGERLFGWRGMLARIDLLANTGRALNDGADTWQGIDNIEVTKRGVRLYEAWVEVRTGEMGHSLRVGRYDLNSEFYSTAAARWLVMPAFGMGSELAASGPNGPSTYPLTALGLRARAVLGTHGGYALAAVVNAGRGLLAGWPEQDRDARASALVIAELGRDGPAGKLAIGAWGYTRRQAVFPPAGSVSDSATAPAHGAYVLAQFRLPGCGLAGRTAYLFTRLGISDGRTTPFSRGAQWGALIERPFAARPESVVSLGVNTGRLSTACRVRSGTTSRSCGAETGTEITYADRVASVLTVQLTMQRISPPAADDDRPVLVGLVRTHITWNL